MTATLPVLAYGVVEREGGPVVALKFDREDAADWIVGASSEYRNRQMPGPAYRTIGLVDATKVAELVEASTMLAVIDYGRARLGRGARRKIEAIIARHRKALEALGVQT